MFIKPILFSILGGLLAFFSEVTIAQVIPQKIPQTPRSQKAVRAQTPSLSAHLTNADLKLGAPIFMRIVKSKSPNTTSLKGGTLELFVENAAGEYVSFKTYAICAASGGLGPKKKMGDHQSPEGFYYITAKRFNPWSSYHLSLNLGYPNAYDKAHGYTGDYLMVHGKCVSIGCYAMTDKGIEEIYTLAQAAVQNGQKIIRVHSFPFEMTADKLAKAQNSQNYPFWQNLKQGWDWFETHKTPPNVNVRSKKYVFSKIP